MQVDLVALVNSVMTKDEFAKLVLNRAASDKIDVIDAMFLICEDYHITEDNIKSHLSPQMLEMITVAAQKRKLVKGKTGPSLESFLG